MKPKKSLGQNFLNSGYVVTTIIGASELKSDSVVLEIGPGKGVLTEKLLANSGKVIAIEKDRELYGYLAEKFGAEIESDKLVLAEGDVLDFDPSTILEYSARYKLVANIPYYITGAIIRKFLTADFSPESMTLLVQKEVADRVVARDGKESMLSISVKAYGEPKYIKKVWRKDFTPAPKVDSAILYIDKISKDNFYDVNETKFFEILRIGFAHKRKTLIKNLGELAGKEKLQEIFGEINLDKKIRPEDLTVADWLELAKRL